MQGQIIETIAFMAIGGFVLFIIIAYGVKVGMKEALDEFKEEIVKEFYLKNINKNNKSH
jgi:hypothetical protein